MKKTSSEANIKPFAPDVRYHGQYATDEEHEANKAAALEFESDHDRVEPAIRANVLSERETAATTTPMGLERLMESNALASTNRSEGLEKRGAELKCFDGHEYGTCWYLPRDDIEEAVDWFCYMNQGYAIDFTSDEAEARNLGVEGN